MYEMLTWRPPFQGKDHQDTLSKIILGDPQPPRRIIARVPKDLETIVLKCLEKDPENRYRSAEALAQDLRRFVRGDPIEATARSPLARLARKALRRPGRLAAAAVVTVLLLVSGLLAHQMWNERERTKLEEYEKRVLAQQVKLLRNPTLLRTGAGNIAQLDFEGFFLPEDIDLLRGTKSPVDDAVRHLEMLSAELRDRFEAPYYLARGLRILRRNAEARIAVEQALGRNEQFVPARILRAELESGNAAMELANDLRGHYADSDWELWWLLAYTANREKRWTEAVRAYEALLSLAREQPAAFYLGAPTNFRLSLGLARLESGDLRKAAEEFAFVRRLRPDSLEPALLLGMAYYLRGDPEGADATFGEIHDRMGNERLRSEAAIWIAIVYVSLLDYERSLDWAGRIQAGKAETSIHSIKERLAAGSLFNLGRIEESRRAARRAVDLDPGDPVAPFFLAAIIYWQQGFRRYPGREQEVAEAVQWCEAAIRIRPQYAAAQALLGLARAELGHTPEAIACVEKAAATESTEWTVVYGVSLVLFFSGEFEKLREFHSRLWPRLDELPPRTRAHAVAWRAHFLYLDGKDGEAIEEYRRALDIWSRTYWAARNIGEILLERGNYIEAERWFREAIRREPVQRGSLDDACALLAETLERLERPADAVRVCCEAILSDARDTLAHRQLRSLLRRYEDRAFLQETEQVVEHLEDAAGRAEAARGASLRRTAAFLRLRVPQVRDVERAHEQIALALEATGEKDAELLALRAEAQRARGDTLAAILTLEGAVQLPGATSWHASLLEECRAELQEVQAVPPSFESIDAALASRAPGEDRSLLAQLERAAPDPSAERLRTYLEGRSLQRCGRPGEAAEKFRALLVEAGPGHAVDLRLAESLRDSGKPNEAEDHLREMLEQDLPGSRRLWDTWISLCLEDLGMSPDEMLADFPGRKTRDSGSPKSLSSYADDIRWLLGQLARGEVLRINCGGDQHRSPSGEPWGRDRFFLGGKPEDRRSTQIEGALDPAVRHSWRGFLRDEWLPVYRIPLPNARYRVTLHVVEPVAARAAPGADSYEVVVEGQSRARIRHGFVERRAAVRPCVVDIEVQDGALDLELRSGAGSPHVAALEVRLLR
jgi:tetratricopeptide (TPR) repeat protein